MHKITIIITNYNLEKYIGTCIRSCIDQTLSKDDYKIIVVDDASTDNSVSIINNFVENNSNIELISLTENKGVSSASNFGLKATQSPYVIRVDADDYINKNLLFFYSAILDWNPDISFVFGDVFRVYEEGGHEERINLKSIDNLYNHGAGIMFRKSCLEAVGLYDETLKNCEDVDLIKRLFKNFDGYHIKLPLYRYRRHHKNMTNDTKGRDKWRKIVDERYK